MVRKGPQIRLESCIHIDLESLHTLIAGDITNIKSFNPWLADNLTEFIEARFGDNLACIHEFAKDASADERSGIIDNLLGYRNAIKMISTYLYSNQEVEYSRLPGPDFDNIERTKKLAGMIMELTFWIYLQNKGINSKVSTIQEDFGQADERPGFDLLISSDQNPNVEIAIDVKSRSIEKNSFDHLSNTVLPSHMVLVISRLNFSQILWLFSESKSVEQFFIKKISTAPETVTVTSKIQEAIKSALGARSRYFQRFSELESEDQRRYGQFLIDTLLADIPELQYLYSQKRELQAVAYG
jgi:hypothetical protein